MAGQFPADACDQEGLGSCHQARATHGQDERCQIQSGGCRPDRAVSNEYFSSCGRSGVEATRLTENRTPYPPLRQLRILGRRDPAAPLRPDLDPANSSSQGYHLLITHATERIPSNTAKGAAAACKPIRKEAPDASWSTGLAPARWLIVGQRPAI